MEPDRYSGIDIVAMTTYNAHIMNDLMPFK